MPITPMVGSFRGQAVSLVLADKGAAGVLGRAEWRERLGGGGRDRAAADLGLRPLIATYILVEAIKLVDSLICLGCMYAFSPPSHIHRVWLSPFSQNPITPPI